MKNQTTYFGLPINIQDILTARTVEWERLEFKAGWNPEPVLHAMCAFANDFHNLGGGYIVIGVAEEKGQPVLPPVGLNPKELDSIQKEVLRLGHLIIPPYHPLTAPCEVEGKMILVLYAPGGQTRPYKAPVLLAKGNREYGYYLRKGSATVRAQHRDEVELISMAATVPFDDRMNQQASLVDLQCPLSEPMTRSEIQVKLSLVDRKHLRVHILRPALDAGWVAMTKPDKPNAADQRYLLTDAGKLRLKQEGVVGETGTETQRL